jgi:hypothetical protein
MPQRRMPRKRLEFLGCRPRAAPVLLVLLVLPGMLLPFRTAPSQEVYKSVDANGNVTYSDRGASKTSPKTVLKVEQGDPAEAARIAKEQQLLKAEDVQRARQDAVVAKNKETEDRQRETACRNARNSFNRLKDSNRLFKLDADGNRVYYSDEEADAMRVQAQRTMTAACGR